MYVGAGGMLEKCVSAKFGSKSVDEPKVQWSVAGAVGGHSTASAIMSGFT